MMTDTEPHTYPSIIQAHKKLGETPYETIQRCREIYNVPTDVKICYTGRLDPMAQGIMPILVGSETKNQASYLSRDKTYEAEAVLGLSTDTYDAMGLITDSKPVDLELARNFRDKLLTYHKTTIKQHYPAYSAFRVGKKPLHWWIRQDRFDEIRQQVPARERQIYHLEVLKEPTSISLANYASKVIEEINLINPENDFRQDQIINQWQRLANEQPTTSLFTLKFRAKVSTGTYIRSLVYECLPDSVPAHAHLINRIEVL